MIDLNCKNQRIKAEMRDIIKMFVPFFEYDLSIYLNIKGKDNHIIIGKKEYHYSCYGSVKSDFIRCKTVKKYKKNVKGINKKLLNRKLFKRLKKNLYKALSDYFNKTLPWGSLTGIRPTKIGYSYISSNGKIQNINKMLMQKYFVSPAKAQIVKEIIINQKDYLIKNDSLVNLYIHIPFCPTKCEYCSFVSLPAEKNEDLINEYLSLLCTEIMAIKQELLKQNKGILSVYIGGGTPSVLTNTQLQLLLKTIEINTDLSQKNKIEFTLEAGRPDTITEEKLQIMREYGVNRISINPQTFLDKTLQAIGRKHSVESLINAYKTAKKYGFIINMDLIAGLNGETYEDFVFSLNKAIGLQPHNLTIHTLSVKNGSKTFENGFRHVGGNATMMLDYAYKALKEHNYLPYYLYRQKNMADNLENVGFCLKDCQSVNNITVMEESVSVWGCGAGAISKIVCGKLIFRHASLRDVKLYIQNFDERLKDKLKFLAK